MTEPLDRLSRLLLKAKAKALAEENETLAWFRRRPDYRPEFEYFLNIVGQGDLAAIADRAGRPVIALLCNQSPLELIVAAGFQPVKIASGSLAETSFSGFGWPALTCPVVKGLLTRLAFKSSSRSVPIVAPATCDWVAKFGEMARFALPAPPSVAYLDLPRFKQDPFSQKKWLSEVYKLKNYLEDLRGGPITRANLLAAIADLNAAYAAFLSLKAARLKGQLSLSWFLLIVGSFFGDTPRRWAENARRLTFKSNGSNSLAKVFLAGSPIFFPNFKLPALMEEAGLTTVADDLCSSERIFPPGQVLEDSSLPGLLASLAGRYHQGCLCPTFGDNDRRINNILGQKNEAGFTGVVFTVLKGCHPYDLESSLLEPALKERNLRFLRLETDYAAEDRQNLLTRLEAFGQSLKGEPGF
ncbi:MAG: 2-hydroxyacyl-CoA dehydratase family protein [Deltaproteobacteria bacterium]|jgi:benzoyl-CoA reductase/2-hydroxyglutaryl-CoA dehydratase subunit BcrC/BadD/HgdB|nr:2-hydroxyacyl-CoA dehydratase family protein [Deltaproteobacteria bacterium]